MASTGETATAREWAHCRKGNGGTYIVPPNPLPYGLSVAKSLKKVVAFWGVFKRQKATVFIAFSGAAT